MEQYIMVPAIKKKLAKSKERIIYVHGGAGYGKTAAVKHYLEKKKYKYFSGHEINRESIGELSTFENDMVVIDDLQWIDDEEVKNQIRRLCEQRENGLILIGRGYLPEWLTDIALHKSILQCDESDFLLGEKEVTELASKMKVQVDDKKMDYILTEAGGYAIVVKIILIHMEAGRDPYNDKKMRTQIWNDVYAYIDRTSFDLWNRELKEMLLPLACFDSFSVEMAEMITGKRDVSRILHYANRIGSFLEQLENGEWEIELRVREFLKWKGTHIYNKEDYELLYRKAALYYEMQGNLLKALEYNEMGNDNRETTRLLIQNANEHPGVAHFFECRHYYMKLPKEEILKNSNLMAGMSMLYSILFMPDESEKWYKALEKYSKEKTLTLSEKKEARTRLSYLNIGLPHRATNGIIQIIKDTFVLVTKKEMTLPEFSVTGNLPSLMYGGKDFCEWSKIDKELAVALKKPIEFLFGRAGKGLVNIALAESGYEKGSMDVYEIQTRLNTGYMLAEAGGTTEMCFAATGILVRLHISRGQIGVAENLLTSFQRRTEKEGARHLSMNIDAMLQWIAMINGDINATERWIINTPDEKTEFCTLNRYCYLQKVRAYLLLQRYSEAIALIEKLCLYFTTYERHHDLIETLLLKAILLHRMCDPSWQEILTSALKKAENYHFVKILAQEGIALKPLMTEYKNEEISESFLLEVSESMKKIARLYPKYLRPKESTPKLLTAKEKEILKLLCQGETAEEICNRCNITYNSLKFHNRNIYKKLGVNSRLEAEQKAQQIGILS